MLKRRAIKRRVRLRWIEEGKGSRKRWQCGWTAVRASSNGKDNSSRGREEDEEVEGGGSSEIGVSDETIPMCGQELSVGAAMTTLPTEEEAGRHGAKRRMALARLHARNSNDDWDRR
ncbi:hypothetical protein BHM03_00057933 [Ensete ventricosum]|nr:hypothetical protein BHM03_00057933 [Ensete ventricosum]